jgi:hypothetical protein
VTFAGTDDDDDDDDDDEGKCTLTTLVTEGEIFQILKKTTS